MGEPFRARKPKEAPRSTRAPTTPSDPNRLKKRPCRELNRTALPEQTSLEKEAVRTLADTKEMTLNDLDLIASFARSFAPDSYFDPPVERTPLAAFPELRGDPPLGPTHGPLIQRREAILDGKLVTIGDSLPAMYPEDYGGVSSEKPIDGGTFHRLPPHRRNKKNL